MKALVAVASAGVAFTVLVFIAIGLGSYLKAHARPADRRPSK